MIGLLTSRIYLISPGHHGDGFDLVSCAQELFDVGARLLQVREPRLKDSELAALVEHLLRRAEPYQARVFVNAGRGAGLRVARRLGAGLHLDATWPLEGVIKELRGLPVGVTVHTLEAARRACAAEPSLMLAGPFRTSAPAGSTPMPLGLEALQTLAREVTCPIYAFGGIAKDTVPTLLEHGLAGVALRSQIFEREVASPSALEGATGGESAVVDVPPGAGVLFGPARRLREWQEVCGEIVRSRG